MSHLIEDSLFYAEFSNGKGSKSNVSRQKEGDDVSHKRQYQSSQFQDHAHNFQVSPYVFGDKNCYVHKIKNLSLVLIRRKLQARNYRFEGFILLRDRKLCIQYKQKRILFGKQWMKHKLQSPVKVSINFSTGQVQLIWPQIFNHSHDSILTPSKTIPKTSSYVFKEFVNIFQNELVPIFHKLNIFYNETPDKIIQNENLQGTFNQETEESQKNTQKILKYLYMSTIIDSFDRDKETFRQIQDKAVKQKQNIIKIQNSIDTSFANISNELKFFTKNTLKKVLRKLANFGIIEADQKRVLEECLTNEEPKGRFGSKHEFILNCIGILQIESKKKFLGAGGSSNVFLTKTKFQYVFSDDPQFWIDQNKTLKNNIIDKYFVIKQAKKGFEEKLRHQNQIIKQMKGGFSIFLPKYYRIENSTSQAQMPRNDNFIIIDYLNGQSLDIFAEKSSEILSFWSKVFLIRNIVNGMRFIIGYKIVHLDLKPSNIIVISDLLTKIIDFSEAYHPKICKQNYVPGITFPYVCPEIFSKKPVNYDQKCDIYSLGVIMYELFLRRTIFQLSKQKIRKIYQNQSYMKRVFIAPQQFDIQELGPIFQIIFQLTMRCLDPRPQMRPTINWISIIIAHVLMYFRGK